MAVALPLPLVTTLAEALARARQQIGAVDARVLLRHVLQCSPAALIAAPERLLDADQKARYEAAIERRKNGEPVAYIVGGREFYGHWLHVTPAVLVPRPETELLVECALQAALPAQARVLDLGTGSGAIAIALALAQRRWQLWAVERSAAALSLAQQNARRLQAQIRFCAGSWFEALPAGAQFAAIVANPPYVAAGDAHLQTGDVRFEPQQALVAAGDGLADLAHIVARAPDFLDAGGHLWLEHGFDQAAAVRDLLAQRGFVAIESWRDLAGIERVSGGRWRQA